MEVPQVDFAAFADVRDVAEAHVLGFQSNEAANQRFIVAGGHFDYQIACDIIRSNFPGLREKTPEGVPGNQEQIYTADGSKAKKILNPIPFSGNNSYEFYQLSSEAEKGGATRTVVFVFGSEFSENGLVYVSLVLLLN